MYLCIIIKLNLDGLNSWTVQVLYPAVVRWGYADFPSKPLSIVSAGEWKRVHEDHYFLENEIVYKFCIIYDTFVCNHERQARGSRWVSRSIHNRLFLILPGQGCLGGLNFRHLFSFYQCRIKPQTS